MLIITSSSNVSADAALLSDVQAALEVPAEERYELYCAQFARFQTLRGDTTPLDPVDPRMKRAKWHYAELNHELPIYPATIKFRALFASNRANEAYHDSTLGFARLAETWSFEGCGDIEAVHDEINFFLDRLIRKDPRGRDSKELRFLRAVSTSLYWLNASALPEFEAVPGWTSVEAELAGLNDLVKAVMPGSGSEHRYVMSIGIKSIVQDHWRKCDPFARRAAHRFVARRLYKRRDQLGLNDEFPMEARFEDNSVLYLAEAIRHLVRSVEDPVRQPSATSPWYDYGWLDDEEADWLDPGLTDEEIIVTCFDHLYDGLLMDRRKRRLTRDHGANSLRLEILQLLSAEAGFGLAHPMMPERLRQTYLADLSFTLLDVGKVSDAEHVFRSILRTLEGTAAEPARIARALIDLAMVLAIQACW